MKVIKISHLKSKINQKNKPLIAIWGFFDGWHLGHQALLNQMLEQSQLNYYQTLVISFDVKPQSVIFKKKLPILLNNQDKINFLNDKKIDYYCQLTFSQQLAKTSAEDFIAWLISNHVIAVVVNRDIHFGYQGRGNLTTLQNSQLQVFLSEDVYDQDHQKISSTYIKKLLEDKKIAHANTLLASNYTVVGKVVDGIKEGRTLGFPTANLALDENYVIPGVAVYISLTEVDNHWYQSMTVVVIRDQKPLVETYILNFAANIYGKTIKVQFLDYLRDNINFPSKEALIAQIHLDLKKTNNYFKNLATLIN